MQHPTFGNGKICYIEMPAIDIQQSADFYSTVFGWNIRNRDDGATSFDDGVGEANGGIIVQPVGMDKPELTAHFTDPAGNRFGLFQHNQI